MDLTSRPGIASVSRFHVTVLSNFARAFDKYTRTYSKAGIPESSFPDRFHLLRLDEIETGVRKARLLLQKLSLPGDELLVLATSVDPRELVENTDTGLGHFVPRGWIRIDGLYSVSRDGALSELRIEDAYARSLQLIHPRLHGYSSLVPRTVSLLPIAKGCQAKCPFCFSEASVSAEQPKGKLDLSYVEAVFREAKVRGASRAVITGGGEPGLVKHEELLEMIRLSARHFPKVVLITNGVHLSRLDEASRRLRLQDMADAGLSVLSVSRHHFLESRNAEIMQIETHTSRIAESVTAMGASLGDLRLRLICVLQKSGISSHEDLAGYIGWGVLNGVREFCFKELYVSTSVESVYHAHGANEWSYSQQVPLSLLLQFAERHQWSVESKLPWGAPVFVGSWLGVPIRVAAYTEPSLLWERMHGIARSWNVMADGSVLASLEDRSSVLRVGA